MSRDDFLADKRTQQAVVMSLIVLGEAATKAIDRYPDFASAPSQTPWRSMHGMRNRIAHGYFDIDLDVAPGRPGHEQLSRPSPVLALGAHAHVVLTNEVIGPGQSGAAPCRRWLHREAAAAPLTRICGRSIHGCRTGLQWFAGAESADRSALGTSPRSFKELR